MGALWASKSLAQWQNHMNPLVTMKNVMALGYWGQLPLHNACTWALQDCLAFGLCFGLSFCLCGTDGAASEAASTSDGRACESAGKEGSASSGKDSGDATASRTGFAWDFFAAALTLAGCGLAQLKSSWLRACAGSPVCGDQHAWPPKSHGKGGRHGPHSTFASNHNFGFSQGASQSEKTTGSCYLMHQVSGSSGTVPLLSIRCW